MAITIDWNTKVISVPKSDLTLVQSNPTEIRELNLNWFRLQLKAIEDDEGMPFLDTHRHNTEVSIAGLTLARVIEIINGYTVTFEDGQYAVNLVGANSNVGDVVNVNQVSVRSFNSAGMTSSPDIEYASYQNCVTVDTTSPYTGTQHPVGTKRQPVNNLADALLIAAYRGLTTLFIVGDIDIDTTNDYSEMTIVGSGMSKSTININANANVYRCSFLNCVLAGVLDGEATAQGCRLTDLEYINGVVQECVLDQGTIVLGGNAKALFLDCWSGGTESEAPTIDLGGSGQELVVRNYSGTLRLKNKNGSDPVAVTLAAGRIHLENTVAGTGLVLVSGVGAVENEGTAPVDQTELVNPSTMSQANMDGEDIEQGLTHRQSLRLLTAAAAAKISGADSNTVKIRNAVADTKDRITALVDQYGNRLSVTYDLSD